MRTTKRTTILTLLVLAMAAGSPGAVRAAGWAGYDPRRDPAADLKAAKVEAKRDGKRILLEVGGEWCPWCHTLQELIASDPEIAARLRQGFVVVKVSWSPENENVPFLSAYPPIYGYPHFFVLDGDGTFLGSQSNGAFEKGGGYDRGKLLAFLSHWSPAKKKS